MNLLTHFTDRIERTVTRGRATGQITREQFAVAADKFNWIVARYVYDENGNQTNEQGLKFFCTFRLLLPCIMRCAKEFNYTVKLEDVFERINKALAEVTKKPLFTTDRELNEENLKAIGSEMTAYYEVNYCSSKDNPAEGSLRGRLFKGKE